MGPRGRRRIEVQHIQSDLAPEIWSQRRNLMIFPDGLAKKFMKRIQTFSVLCLLATAADGSAQVGPRLAVPSDFNFVFQYGHGHILDTSKAVPSIFCV